MAALQEVERAMEPNRRPGAEMAAAHLDWLLAETARHPAAGARLAEDADGPAGFVIWHVETEGGDYVLPANRVLGCITDLYVAPRARRQGLATRLIAAAEAHLAAHGLARVTIAALPANAAARAAYERAGYAQALVVFAKGL